MGRAARIRKNKLSDLESAAASAEPYRRAVEALRARNEAAAIVLLQQVLLADDTHDLARFNLATALLEQGRLADAIEQFHRLLARRPDQTGALVSLAEALRRFAGSDVDAMSRAAYETYWAAPATLDRHVDAIVDLYRGLLPAVAELRLSA